MASIGKYNYLKVLRSSEFGLFLDGGALGDILLPRSKAPANCPVGAEVEVFVMLDSEDRIIATTDHPVATVGEFAGLEVVSTAKMGAFLNWGLPKDLFLPFREQKERVQEGDTVVVYIYLDEASQRIAATTKLHKFLNLRPVDFADGDEVELLIMEQTDLGYRAIISGTHTGMLYANEVFQELEIGQELRGYIKKVREDGKIDLSLQKPGYERVGDLEEQILHLLEQNNGFLAVNSKTPPEIIYEMFGVSKKSFKMGIGALYKKRLIVIEDKGIRKACA